MNYFSTFFKCFFIYIKLSRNLSAKYYQENEGRLQKARQIYQIFFK